MFKSIPFFLVFLPVLLLALGVFLGVANAKGILAVAFGWSLVAVGIILTAFLTEEPAWFFALVVYLLLGIWLLPWLGTAMSFVGRPPEGISPAVRARDAYASLTPEQKELVKRSTIRAMRAGLQHDDISRS